MAPQPPAGAHLRNVSDELLSDRKTWKRRAHFSNGTEASPKYSVGEVLYLKEPYRLDNRGHIFYKFALKDREPDGWKNKLFMPASAARYFIRITGIGEERLQDIAPEDCIKEGVRATSGNILYFSGAEKKPTAYPYPRECYAALIDIAAGRGTWDSNPFVWVYDYEFLPDYKISAL
jgi:hypothetical protein